MTDTASIVRMVWIHSRTGRKNWTDQDIYYVSSIYVHVV